MRKLSPCDEKKHTNSKESNFFSGTRDKEMYSMCLYMKTVINKVFFFFTKPKAQYYIYFRGKIFIGKANIVQVDVF